MRFDPGLQPERTALAWNRTSLALVVGGVAGLRVLPLMIGAAGIVIAVAVIAFGAYLGLAAHRRNSCADAALRSGAPLPGGGLLATTALVVSGAAMAAIATVLWSLA